MFSGDLGYDPTQPHLGSNLVYSPFSCCEQTYWKHSSDSLHCVEILRTPSASFDRRGTHLFPQNTCGWAPILPGTLGYPSERKLNLFYCWDLNLNVGTEVSLGLRNTLPQELLAI